jgi:hypothetical protein
MRKIAGKRERKMILIICKYNRWINCIAVIEPIKKIVGTARACTANHRNVKIGILD